MQRLIISVIFLSFTCGTTWSAAQDAPQSEAHDKAISDPIVIDAYAKVSTPSGSAYREKEFETATKRWFEGDLEVANVVFNASPLEESSFSWKGRREGFLGNYAKAIEIFTEGLVHFPESYALHRYRGYFLVQNYQFEHGIADLRRAEGLISLLDVSPSQPGIPGKSNFSPSTFKRNIYYYLAQSSMATGDYNTVLEYMDKAVEANELRDEDDFLVSTSYYKYMALRKLGRAEEAEALIKDIPDGLDIIENFDYHDAIKFIQGRITRAQVLDRAGSLGKYTVAMMDHFEGENDSAKELWTEVSADNHKGYWLAEAELLSSN